jgi:hypothetical protein
MWADARNPTSSGESRFGLLGTLFHPTAGFCSGGRKDVLPDLVVPRLRQVSDHLRIPQVFVDKLKEIVYTTAIGLAFGVAVVGFDADNIAKLEHIPPWVVSLDGQSE